MNTTMRAFHGDPTIKEKYVARVRAHKLADEIIHGTYWEKGRGCAVGCTIHSSEHDSYETELGIPKVLARLEDRIFEGLNNGEAKEFPEQFLLAINVGSDLSGVKGRFFVWLLTDPKYGVIRFANHQGKIAIQRVSDLYKNGGTEQEFLDAAYAAAYAAYAAAYAAYAAADAAYAAADAAAYAAADAAYAAADAAADAAAYAAYAADAAAKEKSFSIQKKKLLELLREAL